jgi:hypothetical protein
MKDLIELTPPVLEHGEGCCPPGYTPPPPFAYPQWDITDGSVETAVGPVPRLRTTITREDRRLTALCRLGFIRDRYGVMPGLYAVGDPGPVSPVLTTCNYKLTVDAVRRELGGVDAWLLVVDTYAVNVWCAAGKRNFSAQEVAHRVGETRLGEVVEHRTLVLPQLAAPGVAGREVKRLCGFSVAFGPVRAADIGPYLAHGMQADEAMRRVSFTLSERMAVAPVELYHLRKYAPLGFGLAAALTAVGLFALPVPATLVRLAAIVAAMLAGIIAGTILFPALLPHVPGKPFAWKGGLLGLGVGALVLWAFGLTGLGAAGALLTAVWISSYLAMNFTGSTTFTSPSGVEKEMRVAIPVQAVMALVGAVLWTLSPFV